MARPDMYFSVDVEADGPVPGPYSMLSFGVAVAGVFDGARFKAHDPTAATFYAELRPISERFDAEALAVSGLDRDRLVSEGEDPRAAMSRAAGWVRRVAGEHRPVVTAYPASFDWSFLYWYFVSFADGGSPFGFSSVLDMKTMYALKAGVVFTKATKRQVPRRLLPSRPHTHHALEDAVEQAELFANLFVWDGRR